MGSFIRQIAIISVIFKIYIGSQCRLYYCPIMFLVRNYLFCSSSILVWFVLLFFDLILILFLLWFVVFCLCFIPSFFRLFSSPVLVWLRSQKSEKQFFRLSELESIDQKQKIQVCNFFWEKYANWQHREKHETKSKKYETTSEKNPNFY